MIGSYEAGVAYSLWTKRLRKQLKDLYRANGFDPDNAISIYYISAEQKWGCTLYIDHGDVDIEKPKPWELGEEFSAPTVEELLEEVSKNFPKYPS